MLSPDKINMFSSCMFALPAAVAVTLGPAGRGLATGTSRLAAVAAVGLGPHPEFLQKDFVIIVILCWLRLI